MRYLSPAVLIVAVYATAYSASYGSDGVSGLESSNFKVCCGDQAAVPTGLLASCESLRTNLQQKWFGAESAATWRPRCELVLHGSRTSYLQAVGRGGGQTSGSSLVQFGGGRVVSRRIDLLIDDNGCASALAHELTHVVLADRFGGQQPPRWVDEGIATLSDSLAKQRLHDRDCRDALASGTAIRMIDLLQLDQFTSARQVPAFYGQSLSLVSFLAQREEPQRIVEFAQAANVSGYDRALSQYYHIDGVAALERKWRDYEASGGREHLRQSAVTTVGRQREIAE